MARLTPQQAKLAAQSHYGLIPRPPHNVLPSITVRDYRYIIERWHNFDTWRAWRDRGGPKPVNVWKNVPNWDNGYYTPWMLLHDIRLKYPLDNTKPIPPLPVPDRPMDLNMGQCWLVIAQDYWDAIHAPNYMKRAFTADGAYARPSREEIAVYHGRGIVTAAWGDSRPPNMEGTSPQKIVDVANELRTTTIMFQAELLEECRASLDKIDQLGGRGYPLIMNRSAIATDVNLYKRLVEYMHDGRVLGVAECYKNCGWGDPDWGGLPMASTLGATYHDGDCPGMGESVYYDHGWVVAHRDGFYTAQWNVTNYQNVK